jgi:hypothetical protein
MFLLKTIEQLHTIYYAGFLNGDACFNLISTIKDDHPKGTQIGESGLILLSNHGILLELELFFVHPIVNNKPYLTNEEINHKNGVPLLTIDLSDQNSLINPIIYKTEDNNIFVLFIKNRSINLRVESNGAAFLFDGSMLVGIELSNFIIDPDGTKQNAWIKKYNLFVTEEI